MCKHVHIAPSGIRFAQLVICMRLHTDRIHNSKTICTEFLLVKLTWLFPVMQFNQL